MPILCLIIRDPSLMQKRRRMPKNSRENRSFQRSRPYPKREREKEHATQSGSRPQPLMFRGTAVEPKTPPKLWSPKERGSGGFATNPQVEGDLPRDLQVSVEGIGLFNGNGNLFVAVGIWIAPGHKYNGGAVVPLEHSMLDASSAVLAALHGIAVAKKLKQKFVCIKSRCQNLYWEWSQIVNNRDDFDNRFPKSIVNMLHYVEGMEVTFLYQERPKGWYSAWQFARRAYNKTIAARGL